MVYFYVDWLSFIIFIIAVFFVACILLLINILLVIRNNYFEKISPYECGFEPFDKILVNFDVKYYIIAILFLLFDLELIFIIPWIACFDLVTSISFWIMMFFIFILIISFFYEWQKGGLEWS